ncbi:hypothetical protein BDN72DRAFT_849030 [Pluteus cervinus]|uniref:Uncharacterized protein n=1 Tax=Pluteus cervinus TaxID=181527 RepID=A0ACD3A8U0_9AGAR|nr:hypothetical protein BDN72DRAFT_849030 [Pluteus cervinus]
MRLIACFWCNKTFPASQLKKCARCLCSRQCQKEAWSGGHNRTCTPHSQAVEGLLDFEEGKTLVRWINVWMSILCRFALASLDLANHPADYNATHMMVLWLAPRAGARNSAEIYRISRGDVWPLERCNLRWPDLNLAPTEGFEDDRLRLVVQLEDEEGQPRTVRTMTWISPVVSLYRENVVASRTMSENWVRTLSEIIERGDVEAAGRYLDSTLSEVLGKSDDVEVI